MWYAVVLRCLRRRLVLAIIFLLSLTYFLVNLGSVSEWRLNALKANLTEQSVVVVAFFWIGTKLIHVRRWWNVVHKERAVDLAWNNWTDCQTGGEQCIDVSRLSQFCTGKNADGRRWGLCVLTYASGQKRVLRPECSINGCNATIQLRVVQRRHGLLCNLWILC